MRTDLEAFKKAAAALNALESYMEIQTKEVGALAGFDLVIKDNINVLGTKTTASSHILANYESVVNATVIDKLLDAGARLLGKSSMDELGMGGTNETSKSGPVLNARDHSRIAGGSSGGSAALVGAGVIRGALGTDTGDSVRKPASYNGIVGLKPTYGLVSRYGVIPYASSMDHVGIFAQNVADAALVLETISGFDAKDMTTSQAESIAYSKHLDGDLSGRRIGVFKSVMDTMENADAIAQFNAFVRACEAKGAVIVEKTMDTALLNAIFPVYQIIANAEASSNHASLDGIRFGVSEPGDTLEEIMIHSRTKGFGYQVRKRHIYGMYALRHMDLFIKAKQVRRVIVDAYAALFDDVDVLVSLAIDHGAPKVGEPYASPHDAHALVAENYMAISNFSGFPSITIPLGHVEGLPIGMNINAPAHQDATLLSVSHQFETVVKEGTWDVI